MTAEILIELSSVQLQAKIRTKIATVAEFAKEFEFKNFRNTFESFDMKLREARVGYRPLEAYEVEMLLSNAEFAETLHADAVRIAMVGRYPCYSRLPGQVTSELEFPFVIKDKDEVGRFETHSHDLWDQCDHITPGAKILVCMF